ncbi:hypothetical protein AVEN_4170-1 [Araneus ventricosus]|uniref:Uncharacterized protein n=1 Tax=Araneus ventricosus TaxID=182803 RepID=A0A4Y2FJD4_ARAVE|nr:hypothetical protein AVEN_4170-1 [Araneus ventricosus]
MTECVKAKLKEFRITIEKHIVACVTVGASMTASFGKTMSYEYHLYYVNAIHMPVCDVLYKKIANLRESTVERENISHEKGENIDESEELIENFDKVLDLEFEGGIAADAMFYIAYAERIR